MRYLVHVTLFLHRITSLTCMIGERLGKAYDASFPVRLFGGGGGFKLQMTSFELQAGRLGMGMVCWHRSAKLDELDRQR